MLVPKNVQCLFDFEFIIGRCFVNCFEAVFRARTSDTSESLKC